MNAHDVTVILTGGLIGILCSAAVFTAPMALWLIGRYRRTVIRLMSKSARPITTGLKAAKEPVPVSSGARATPEFVFVKDTPINQGVKNTGIYTNLTFRRWQASAVYAFGGLVFAVILTEAHIVSLGLSFSIRDFVLVWYRLWPMVLIVNLIASTTRRTRMITIGVYFGIWILLNTIAIAMNPISNWAQAIVLWGQINVLPTVLLAAFLYRRIQAVGPMVFTLLSFGFLGMALLGTYGGSALVDQAIKTPSLVRTIIYGMMDVGFSIWMIIGLYYLLTFLMMVIIGWFILQTIKSLYIHKHLSDYSIVLDPLLIIFALVFSSELVFQNPWWIFTGFVGFAAYKIVTWIGFIVLNHHRMKTRGPKLLLLRVFSLGKRSEQLYRAIAKAWRYVGSICFITGPDLAASTVEPHNFLDYISGKLTHHFIDSSEALERRIANAEAFPQLDGRYRKLDFFCHDDTWKMVLSRLAKDSDVILMDLRNFSRSNAGCVFEINELVNFVPLNRVVFVIDETTDEGFLRESMEKAWEQMNAESPNRKDVSCVRLFQYSDKKVGAYNRLLQALSAAAG